MISKVSNYRQLAAALMPGVTVKLMGTNFSFTCTSEESLDKAKGRLRNLKYPVDMRIKK